MNYLNYGGFGMMGAGIGSVFLLVMVWSLVWKGLALWRAAGRKDKWWFIAILLINTLGILEIVYLFGVTGAKLSDFTGGTSSQPAQN